MSTAANSRTIVAQFVRENKEVLLGAFSPQLTKKMKEEAWEEVRKNAVAAGCVNLEKRNWQYVRDSLWSAMRRDRPLLLMELFIDVLLSSVNVSIGTH
ncbi:hypothetical protein GPALN_005826 [Globodera pallida]|uniref:Regulatory protein zeste n=1 Tax=Globodera pallida TaxID=36090 RepID=A0A183CB17_GLOPA|nr:hypothetical protein GPALN_005826 [Globodera pallida]